MLMNGNETDDGNIDRNRTNQWPERSCCPLSKTEGIQFQLSLEFRATTRIEPNQILFLTIAEESEK